MESIKKLFQIGAGPSSSHTMAPRLASEQFKEDHSDAVSYRVHLFASLAATGRGHLTDEAIYNAFSPFPVEIIWRKEESLPLHPNGMRFEALDAAGVMKDHWEVYSTGGGALLDTGIKEPSEVIYPFSNMSDILAHCTKSGEPLWAVVERLEGDDIWDFLNEIWDTMVAALTKGLDTEGALPGGLGLTRQARSIQMRASMFNRELQASGLLAAYAYAVAEENASGGKIVTAPTCGSCGVVPGLFYYLSTTMDVSRNTVLKALATAGLVGNLVKHNGSVSGAEVGCQGEIGTACAMAAAGAAQMLGGTVRQIEYAAEMGLEHHLGLTCDPIEGLVQIPCIERNAHAATRALSCSHFALLSDGHHKVSLDEIIAVMKETGHALPSLYRETSAGGLAEAYRRRDSPGI